MSAQHLARLAGGLTYAATSRPPWALLLQRTFAVDVLKCARCGGSVRVRAVVMSRATAPRIRGALQAKPSGARDPPSATAAA